MTSPANSSSPCLVAFEGFGVFEHAALASFFRLADPRAQVHRQRYRAADDRSCAELLIVNADRADVVEAVRAKRRTCDAVFVGDRAPPGAIAWVARPIEPVRIVRELDMLVAQRRSGRPAAGTAHLSTAVDLLLEDLGTPAPTGRGAASSPSMARPSGGNGRDALVVDDSAIARRFLAQRLERFGYRVQLASSGEQAVALCEQRSFTVAFVDLNLGPANVLDGLCVCQSIRQVARRDGAPAVVLVSSQADATTHVRAALAGSVALLSKPLMEPDLIAAMRAADPQFEPETAAA
jgi:CheY-like chemotaxis protein